MKILIIEDNPTNMKLVSLLVEKAGYSILTASEAETGIAMARKEHPDLILMDIQLPGIDGLTATSILKGDVATRDIPVIALTAFAMDGDREKMLAGGCDGYITKPIHHKQLITEIKRCLE
ncbi:MAG: response regulator [Zetaproteobacteria bacterium]|nr:MAG: response regulator [Zetaproteobacteria bacterium]